VENEYGVIIKEDDGSRRERVFSRERPMMNEGEIIDLDGASYRVDEIMRQPSTLGPGIVEASRFVSRGYTP
jgi:hypothetical protein